jgi:hypothetical protein
LKLSLEIVDLRATVPERVQLPNDRGQDFETRAIAVQHGLNCIIPLNKANCATLCESTAQKGGFFIVQYWINLKSTARAISGQSF